MKIRNYIVLVALCVGCIAKLGAQQWTTHFAYNNVTQIALSATEVYAISDGNLFSVNKSSKEITKYDRQSGLHGTGITCIHYDAVGKQLIIAYANGKIDVMTANSNVRYISDLYNKDMTQRKDIYNITIQGRIAYLSTHYGVQTMGLRDCKLVDSYWLRPNGEETPIRDVLIQGDSIYAFLHKDQDKGKKDSLFCASLHDNLEDYTAWKREGGNRISPDANKGKVYVEGDITWYAGEVSGVLCALPDTTLSYKPQGPLVNAPYSMTAHGTELWVVPGKSGAVQGNISAKVMRYDGSDWISISESAIQSKTGQKALDFVNVAVDPKDKKHYYITSYGTGLYEFNHDTLVSREIAGGDNLLGAAAASDPQRYTRIDYATYDRDGNLWLLNAGAGSVQYQLLSIDTEGEWHGIKLIINEDMMPIYTPGGLVMDRFHSNYKWIAARRSDTKGIFLLNDNNTRYDTSDDRLMYRAAWTDQYGHSFVPTNINAIMQDSRGRLWIGTEIGVVYVDSNEDYFTSDAVIIPDVIDINGENPLPSQEIRAICEDEKGNIWIGTASLGIYVLSTEADKIVAQYTTENSAMPSNGILSLARDASGKMYIGTDEGIVCYDDKASPSEGETRRSEDEELDMGHMQQWRLHYSYRSPSEIVLAPNRVYAKSKGALFSLDLKNEELEYWTKSTGLTSSVVQHIAYDEQTKQLIVGYEDGRLDLLADDGSIRQMPDITLKASSIPITINAISIGSQYVYLSMPFGVIALNARKAEVASTYYIGDEASAVDVLQVLELGDSLYAFTSELVYSASLKDDLANYAYWHKNYLPTSGFQQSVLHQDKIYTLQYDSLYRKDQNNWSLVRPEGIQWIHALNNHLLVYISGKGLYSLTDDNQLDLITNKYALNDACYSNGIYWLAETNFGLIRVNPNGDDYFHPDGPNCNYGYSMYTAHDQLYIAAGGRWAVETLREANINIYNGSGWRSIDVGNIGSTLGKYITDLVSIAIDPNDAGHFFAASYGRGVVEFNNYQAIQQYSFDNSTLREVKLDISHPEWYTRTDGAMMDKYGNFWVLNATTIGQPVHVMTPKGEWHGLNLRSNNTNISLTTPTGIWIDRRNYQRKWLLDQRATQGVILLDDGGTPTLNSDDRCVKRQIFVDQNGNTIQPPTFHSWAQDYSNRIWIGTNKGILIIPSNVDFFSSNSCRRIIIPRNDGTGLGDYLLGEEQINCMVVDGGNRMWIGTQNSGLYLIEDDTITVAHFTERNSLLPSNAIQSIAIMPTTGEVFVGTDQGIASYRSDASEAKADLSQAYAFPNPVRPDYGGMISIAGLMENTTVNIIDASGNLVCKTRSHGGLAVWDGRLYDGRRATPGVYTALCNAEGAHTVVKILVIR